MSKSRTITGFGPTKLVIGAGSTVTAVAGPWIKFGPFSGRSVTAFAVAGDTATSNAMRLDFALTTESTVSAASAACTFGDLTSASGSSYGPKRSTGDMVFADNFAFVRAYSSEHSVMSTGRVNTIWLVAGNPTS